MPELNGWENFYVIVGSSAGALIGLQFVFLTLIAERPRLRMVEASRAFSTPTIVHFAIVLFVSAMISAPWHAVEVPACIWGAVGVGGIIYLSFVLHMLRIQDVYKPVVEDWIFHIACPMLAYMLLVAAAVTSFSAVVPALFMVGTAMTMLLFAGIHNSWDSVAYHVFVQRPKETIQNARD